MKNLHLVASALLGAMPREGPTCSGLSLNPRYHGESEGVAKSSKASKISGFFESSSLSSRPGAHKVFDAVLQILQSSQSTVIKGDDEDSRGVQNDACSRPEADVRSEQATPEKLP